MQTCSLLDLHSNWLLLPTVDSAQILPGFQVCSMIDSTIYNLKTPGYLLRIRPHTPGRVSRLLRCRVVALGVVAAAATTSICGHCTKIAV